MPTKEAGHSLYNGPILVGSGYETWSTAEVGMHYRGFQCRLDMLPDVFEDRYPPGLPPFALFRERLARLKSSLNLTMVRKYKDRRGNDRVQGGPDLTASAEYPIQLGLKAWPLVLVALAPWYTNLKLYWPLWCRWGHFSVTMCILIQKLKLYIYIYVGILLKGCSKILEMELLSDISSIAHCGKYPYIYIYICTFQQCMFADLNAMELDFVLSF